MTSPAHGDPLQRAARALRDEADEAIADASDSTDTIERWQTMDDWRRVSREVRRNARRRRLGMMLALQLLIALAGVGAWAAVSGQLPPLLWRLISSVRRVDSGPAGRTHLARSSRHAPAAPAPTPTFQALAPTVPTPIVPARSLRVATSSHSINDAPSARAASGLAPPTIPDPDDIYARAHRAQFVLHDYVAALALWDAYLANNPGGLALEARWNRAIALIRLGRREEALAALAPFAAGENDGYRQDEAQALLRAWGPTPP